jgi:hypothetical protein
MSTNLSTFPQVGSFRNKLFVFVGLGGLPDAAQMGVEINILRQHIYRHGYAVPRHSTIQLDNGGLEGCFLNLDWTYMRKIDPSGREDDGYFFGQAEQHG